MKKEQIKEKYGLTEDQFCGKELIKGNLDMGFETEIPDGFNPKVEGSIILSSLTSVGNNVTITAGYSIFLRSLTSMGNNVTITTGVAIYLDSLTSVGNNAKITTGGSINLDSLTSVGNNAKITTGYSINLSSLTSIEDGVNITTGGDIILRSLTSMGNNVTITARNSIHLSSLTAMGDNVTITAGGYIHLNDITSMGDNINITAGDYIYFRSLTSVGGNINIAAGDTIYLDSLTLVRDAANITAGRVVETPLLSQANKQNITVVSELHNFIKTSDGKYIIADGILGELLHERNSVYKCKRIAQEEIFYVVTDGNGIYSHGESISDARDSLVYKLSERADKEQYRNLSLTHKLSFKDATQCYRSITGACAYGVKSFVEKKEINKRRKYSIKEIVELTVGEYGNDSFKEFFEVK